MSSLLSTHLKLLLAPVLLPRPAERGASGTSFLSSPVRTLQPQLLLTDLDHFGQRDKALGRAAVALSRKRTREGCFLNSVRKKEKHFFKQFSK
jgi:hypothetical protein